jgi:hypothetical protein
MEKPLTSHGRLMRVLALCAVLGLNACADGGAILSEGTACGVPLTTATGIWIGSGQFVGGGTTVGMIGGGDLLILQLTGDNPLNVPVTFRFYVGRYDVQTLTGTADVYDGGGRLLRANEELRIGVATTLNVTVGLATTLMPMCPLNDVTLTPLYDRSGVAQDGASLIVGTWQFEVPNATPPYTLNYTMDENRNLDGNDTPGCIYVGSWRSPNPLRNLYRIEDLSLTSQITGACDGFDESGTIPFDGDGYEGFAFILDPDPNQARILWAAVANGSVAYFNRFIRVSPPPDLPPPIDEDDEFDF